MFNWVQRLMHDFICKGGEPHARTRQQCAQRRSLSTPLVLHHLHENLQRRGEQRHVAGTVNAVWITIADLICDEVCVQRAVPQRKEAR